MIKDSHLVFIDIALLAVGAICFARMFYYQVRLILQVVRPFRTEDDIQLGPLTFMGSAKGQRLYDFAGKPDPTGMRGKWARSWAYAICAVLALIFWAGVLRDLIST